jgi:GT2 family glycosyltransferase
MQELDEKEISEGIPLISGCFMFVRTETLKEVGGFDELYFLYFEDFDLSIRIGKLGKVVYAPRVRIVHHGGNAAGKGFHHLKMFIQSGIRFFNKHGW